MYEHVHVSIGHFRSEKRDIHNSFRIARTAFVPSVPWSKAMSRIFNQAFISAILATYFCEG